MTLPTAPDGGSLLDPLTWVLALGDAVPGDRLRAVARAAIEAEGDDPTPGRAEGLAVATLTAAAGFRAMVPDVPTDRDLRGALAGFLAGYGPPAAEYVDAVRAGGAAEGWSPFWLPAGTVRKPTPPPWVGLLARVCWVCGVRSASAALPPAVVLPFALGLAARPGVAPWEPVGPDTVDLPSAAGLLDTPIADRFFAWLLVKAAEEDAKSPLRPLNMYSVRIDGGDAEIARQLGLAPGRASAEIGRIREALGRIALPWDVPGVSKGSPLPLLHTLSPTPAAPGRPAGFALGLSPVWTPKLAPYMFGSERLLVFWLPLPDLDGVNTKHARGAVLLWRNIRVDLLLGAADLARGGVALDPGDLARRAGLSEPVVVGLLAEWSGDGGPLRDLGGRYLVRDPGTVAALISAGELREKRSRAGKKRALKQRK